jgi:alkylation response protein AidB-like acyl-CoA dehydrogenase
MAGSADELKARVLPDILAGRKISALAITEPGGGSDVASLQHHRAARRRPLCGQAARRPSSPPACAPTYHTVAVRTGGEGPGGVSLLLIEARYARLLTHAAEEDGLVGVGHRDPAFRRMPGARRQL